MRAPTIPQSKPPSLKPIAFGERVGGEPYNASEIVAIDDSRFLFCDNNVGDALFELRLAADGSMACPLIRRPLHGLEAEAVDDLEGMTLLRAASRPTIFALPSLSLKRRKKASGKKRQRGKESDARSGLLRISVADEDRLEAELLTGFRDWLVDHVPELSKSATLLPDDGGLNVEGLGWSQADQALLLGLRTPVIDGRPLVLRVRFKRLDGPLDLVDLEMLPPIRLAIQADAGEQGIRTIGSHPPRGVMLIVVGNSTSDSKAPFALYTWDGNAEGVVRHLDGVRFHKKMKVEGVTYGALHGRGAVVFVDDAGGYQILWDDDPRLGRAP